MGLDVCAVGLDYLETAVLEVREFLEGKVNGQWVATSSDDVWFVDMAATGWGSQKNIIINVSSGEVEVKNVENPFYSYGMSSIVYMILAIFLISIGIIFFYLRMK